LRAEEIYAGALEIIDGCRLGPTQHREGGVHVARLRVCLCRSERSLCAARGINCQLGSAL
jgi:hypothetical protein